MNPKFNPDKAIEVLLYVAKRCRNMYTALKVVYFVDKMHLSRYGRLICGDRYVAMSHGPVPSGLYDIVKFVRGDGAFAMRVPAKEAFTVRDYDIIPVRDPNPEHLSDSDMECLEWSIGEYGRKTFAELKAISHQDPAFLNADPNDLISTELLAKSLPDGEALCDYLTDARPRSLSDLQLHGATEGQVRSPGYA